MKQVKYILSFGLGFISFLLFMEFFFSSAGISVPSINVDTEKGERYLPNRTVSSLFTTEGFGLARTNAKGWFGKSYDKKNDSLLSIAVIGNSYVAARQVFERNNFIVKAEKVINKSGHQPPIALYNFGKEALPVQELLYVIEEIETDYNPDYMLVLLTDRSFGRINRMIPFYELNEGKLKLNTAFKQSSNFKIYSRMKSLGLEQSSLVYLLYRVKNRLSQTPSIIFDKFYIPRGESNENIENIVLQLSETDQTVLKAIDKKRKIIFVLSIDSDKNKLLETLIESSPVISLKDVLEQIRTEGMDPNYWHIDDKTGHWNNIAHRLVGEVLAEELLNIIENEDEKKK